MLPLRVVATCNDWEMNVTIGTGARVKRKRRDEQATAMKEKLCVAALETISQVGYHASTTTLIARRAGVSRGAQTHHYPSKFDLVTAAFSYLLSQWETKRSAYLETRGADFDAKGYIDFLWEEIFNGRYYVAMLEIMLAARADERLKNALGSELKKYSGVRISIWRSFFFPAISPEQSDTLMQMTICLFRGMSMQSSLDAEAETLNTSILNFWRAFLSSQIQQLNEAEGKGGSVSSDGDSLIRARR
jgi:AcrR family transcriptional regulator